MKRHFHSILLALFFISGFTGLCFEICWIRSAGQIFGSTNFAVSSVVALFFTGMALGSHYFGGRSRNYAQPLKAYAVLEIGIGIFAISSPYLLSIFEIPYHLLYPVYYQNTIVISTIRLILIALIIIPPTFLMGGTLPLFSEYCESTGRSTSDNLAFLYALNTFGAATGCLVCGFVLIPLIGIRTTLNIIGLIAASGGAYILYARNDVNRCDTNEEPVVSKKCSRVIHYSNPVERGVLYAVIFGTGFCALSYEILWTRFLSLITHNTVYTYTISLLTALVGIAIGSYLTRTWSKDDSHVMALGAVQIVSAIFVLLSFLRPPSAWKWAASSESPLVILMTCVELMLIPSLLSGLSFPLLFDVIRHTDLTTGSRVGRTLAINTAGCVAGSMVTGFILLPFLGMHITLVMTTYICLMLGIFVLVFLERGMSRWSTAATAVISLSVWIGLVSVSDVSLPQDYLAQGKTLIDFVEGKNSFISVTRKNGDIEMEMDRMWQGQKSTGHQILAAHLPMLLHPSAKDVLVVGVGAGQAPSRFLYYDIARLDCVDLESRIPEVLKKHFSADWLNDRRTHFIVDDGNNYLRNIDRTYDLISVEVGQIFRPQVSTFYNVEFYRNARKRLAKDGIISQFLPVGFFTEEQLKSVIKTFISEFPYSTLWYNRHSELILIGSPNRNLAIRKDGVQSLRSNIKVISDLFFGYPGTEEYFLNKPETLAASFLMGPEGLARISSGAEIASDDRPTLEYGTSRTNFSAQRFKRLFEEQHESAGQIIGFTDITSVISEVTAIQHRNIDSSFK